MVGTVLDTVIGLSFVFALTALMVTACVEGVAAVTKKRAKWLLRGIQQLFAAPTPDPVGIKAGVNSEQALYTAARSATTNSPSEPKTAEQWVHSVVSHSLIRPLSQRKVGSTVTRLPSEIPSEQFARVLIDLLTDAGSEGKPEDLKLDGLPPELENALRAIIKSLPKQDSASLKKAIEDWYNAQMKAVGEAYRRWTKRWAIPIGIVAAGILNVSTISIAHALYVDQPVRDATVAAATSGALCEGTGDDAETEAESTRTCVKKEIDGLDAKGLPIGWPAETPDGPLWGVLMVLGWILTGLAASFGAPFWFDALKRLSGAKKTLEGA